MPKGLENETYLPLGSQLVKKSEFTLGYLATCLRPIPSACLIQTFRFPRVSDPETIHLPVGANILAGCSNAMRHSINWPCRLRLAECKCRRSIERNRPAAGETSSREQGPSSVVKRIFDRLQCQPFFLVLFSSFFSSFLSFPAAVAWARRRSESGQHSGRVKTAH